MKYLNARIYLFIALAAIGALPVMWLGVSQASRIDELARRRMDESARTHARAVQRELEQLIETKIREVELLAGHIEDPAKLPVEKQQQMLHRYRTRAGGFSFMYVADKAGVSLVTDPPVGADGRPNAGTDYSDRDYYRELVRTKRTAVSRVQEGRRSGVPNLQIAAPVLARDGSVAGFVEGSVSLSLVRDVVERVADEAENYELVVIDAQRRLLADTRVDAKSVLSDVTQTELFAPAGAPSVRTAPDEAGVSMTGVAAGVRVQGGDWTVVTYQPREDVLAHAADARRQTLLVTVVALFIALLLAGLLSQWLAVRLNDIVAALDRFGRGDFSGSVRPPRIWEPREVRSLLTSVSSMAERLDKHTEKLEALVADRTTELEASNERLLTLVNALEKAGDAIEITDSNGEIIYTNPAFERLTGYSAPEARGRTPSQLLRSDKNPAGFYEKMEEVVRGGEVWQGVCFGKRKDGSPFDQDLTVWPVRDRDGVLTHFVAVRRDVTEKRLAEEALRVSERMASVGTLAAGVAHEINNPLTYVVSNVAVVEDLLSQPPNSLSAEDRDEAIEALRDASVGAARVRDIVASLKTLSRADEEAVGPLDVEAVLESSIKIAMNEVKHRASLSRDYDSVPFVHGNEAKLGQVFLNLIVNAAQAIGDGHARENTIRLATSTDAEGRAVVEISDSGCGIPPEVLPNIFDPFYTTKPIGVGTGLGLSICHGIVRGMGGSITAESEVGKGTTFRVAMPAAAKEPRQRVDSKICRRENADRRLRILIIDDDRVSAKTLARRLRAHEVKVTGNGRDGLLAIEKDTFDIIFCDVMMPDMTGVDVHDKLGEHHPELLARVVFVTGGAFTARTQKFLSTVANPCLQKPFSQGGLEAAIDLVMRGRAA